MTAVADVTGLGVGTYFATGTFYSATATNSPVDLNVELSISKALATVTLNDLSQTYNGAARPASGETSPTGLAVVLTYDGLPGAPTNAGSYEVIGMVDDASYHGGTTGTLTIARAADTI